ncbi:MAG TPA: DUF5677 domain-containing protein [Terriglobales bacterium]|nr:DUF5677 domain-containing protein [Terriglobales bacterium]
MSNTDSTPTISLYGFSDAATAFDQRHPQWTAVMSRLGEVIDLAFTRTQVMDTSIDKFVYFYGSLVAEDFMELFLMAANGYGYGAMKLLRSMYEHTITLKYLHDHPDELQTFFDFDRVQQYKLMKPIFDTFGDGSLPPDIVADTERRYAEVKARFMVKSCKSKTCEEKRVGHTWNKLDFVSMAKKTGAIGSLIVPGYFYPLRHAHSTSRAMTERLEKGEGHLGFSRESQPKEADEALMSAHNCLLVALEVQEERFKIDGLQAAIQKALRDWALIWSPESLA